jgi:membrane protein required for colicin V production
VNWLDVAIIVVLLWFTFTGLTTGLVREIVPLGAAVIGVVLAGHFYLRLADDIKIVYDNPTVDRLVAFVSIFGASVLAGEIVAGMLKGTASLLLLGPADQVVGFFFGLLKGAIVVELVLIGFAVFPAANWMTTAMNSSLIAPVFLSGVPWLLHLLPGSFSAGVRAF